MYKSKISIIGKNITDNVVTNYDLEKIMDTTNEWIVERTGIHERRFVTQHQANQRITEAVAQRLEIPIEKIYSNIHRYENTTAASIPIAIFSRRSRRTPSEDPFGDALSEGKFKKGNRIVIAAFGSGFTWASALIKW